MEQWIVVALVCPLFWALSNIVDKIGMDHAIETPQQFMFLLSQFYTVVFVGWLMVTGIGGSLSLLAVLVGALLFVLYYLYAFVLNDEDITSVIAVHQIEPFFVMLLALVLYSRLPTGRDVLGFILIIVGIHWFTSWRTDAASTRKPLISLRSTGLLVASAMIGAIATIISDVALTDMRVMDIAGQSALGYGGSGLIALSIKKYRARSFHAGRIGLPKKAGLVFLAGVFDLLGYVSFYKALNISDKPAMVSAVSSIHPIYVFILSAALSQAFPNLMREDNGGGRFSRKAIGSLIVLLGVMAVS
ncbi:EamA family transporter [Sinorhizobium psoraleae]|uniref:EamA family transporter n=1 Tax=Sinorhizobium psoraleae TaxID=520838 RepID=A0ABT4KMP0_9HYPH|nr:EamA family transporter [Sinorhizobium psoraleae]MCZ4093221.1 EamA family transporter [Sinorhizobium psoraleae]